MFSFWYLQLSHHTKQPQYVPRSLGSLASGDWALQKNEFGSTLACQEHIEVEAYRLHTG
ncbi:hypothetical protein BofuT4_P050570.1 [Botrytis cinerea T4]|uniref:Uncharacterized protein n=1 Tax=Botryotinia fuckeliana (strain T4) TaxID=999810 RepID=G2XXT0_BOTF4|nr:hypothetical protein BofuT4_P050570.1 [Botrytis cinerea T4]